MAVPTSAYKDRQFLAVIGDEVCFSYLSKPEDVLDGELMML
jgi:hypothetical protein